jgi:hypothetical protein
MKFIKLIVGAALVALVGCYGSPFQKTLVRNDSHISHLEPVEGKVKLVVIRPYNYSYYGHAIDVLINNISQVSIPNQSFSVLTASSGTIEIHAQSGLLGPPSRDIKIEGKTGEVVYLIMENNYHPKLFYWYSNHWIELAKSY